MGVVFLGWAAASAQNHQPTIEPANNSAARKAEHQTTENDLKALADPTILQRRVWLETEWDKYQGGIHEVEETLGALWAWGVLKNMDWGVRLKIPYEWRITDGPGSDNGLGDLKLATGASFRLSPSWRAAGGLELRMPTAADHLGDRDCRLQEFGSVAWDATRWLSLSPSFEYNRSLVEVGNARPQNYLEVYFPVTFLLPRRWSFTARYEAKVDFEKDNYVIQSAKVQIAKQLDDPPLSFALALKKPFDGGLKEFQVNFLITYFFR